MANEDMPFFHQFPNACGLTSLLMALKPASRKIDLLLDYGWDRIGTMFHASPKESRELHWQRVLEYLLTACTQHPALRAYLTEHYPTFSEEECPWFENALLNLKWGDTRRVNPALLRATNLIMRRVKTMKHDVELKILAFLFGCRFLLWEKGGDCAGAAIFTREELLEKRKGHDASGVAEKLAFIKKGLQDGGPVIWGASFHWLAPRDMQQDDERQVLFYHDPMGGGDHSINVTAFHETDRFYVFRFDAKLLEEHAPIIRQAFDIPETPPEIPVDEAPLEEKPPMHPATIDEGIEEVSEGDLEKGEEQTVDKEFSDEELLKIEAFAKKVRALQDAIAEKDKQLAEKTRQLAEKNKEIKELRKQIGKSPH